MTKKIHTAAASNHFWRSGSHLHLIQFAAIAGSTKELNLMPARKRCPSIMKVTHSHHVQLARAHSAAHQFLRIRATHMLPFLALLEPPSHIANSMTHEALVLLPDAAGDVCLEFLLFSLSLSLARTFLLICDLCSQTWVPQTVYRPLVAGASHLPHVQDGHP